MVKCILKVNRKEVNMDRIRKYIYVVGENISI